MEDKNIYSPPESDLEVSGDSELASRWARLGGSLIDGIIAMIVMGPVMYLTGYWNRAMANEISILETLAWGLAGLFFYLLVNGYLLARHGQTVGKMAVGIRIVSVETNQIIPLWRVFFVRYLPQALAPYIPVVGVILLMINYLFVFRKDKRCIHDLIAKTRVVKA